MFNNRLLAILLLASVYCRFDAEALELSPLGLTVNAEEGRGTFRLKNSKDYPVLFSSSIYEWSNSSDLSSIEPTDSMIVFPPIFELQPGEEQVIRVALREPSNSSVEQTFRLITSEVPSELDATQGISFKFQISVPIFVLPAGAKSQPSWALKERAGGGMELVLTNHGNAHLQIQNMIISSGDHKREIYKLESGGYIFAGEQRSWTLAVKQQDIQNPLTINATTSEGSIQDVISTSGI